MHLIFFREIHENYPTFVLFDPPQKTGDLMAPVQIPRKKTLQYPTQDSQDFQWKRVSMLGFVSILRVSPVRMPHDGMCVNNINAIVAETQNNTGKKQKFNRVFSPTCFLSLRF